MLLPRGGGKEGRALLVVEGGTGSSSALSFVASQLSGGVASGGHWTRGGRYFIYRPGVDGISFTVHPFVAKSRPIHFSRSRLERAEGRGAAARPRHGRQPRSRRRRPSGLLLDVARAQAHPGGALERATVAVLGEEDAVALRDPVAYAAPSTSWITASCPCLVLPLSICFVPLAHTSMQCDTGREPPSTCRLLEHRRRRLLRPPRGDAAARYLWLPRACPPPAWTTPSDVAPHAARCLLMAGCQGAPCSSSLREGQPRPLAASLQLSDGQPRVGGFLLDSVGTTRVENEEWNTGGDCVRTRPFSAPRRYVDAVRETEAAAKRNGVELLLL
ncbi:hypothetical protein ACP70R_027730 [Stipagrostis hirtigluma subsp. patula]